MDRLPQGMKGTSSFSAEGDPPAHQLDNGNWQIDSLKVFKAGSFKDSTGEEHTWTDTNLQQMVANFDILKAQNIFPNVPVRADHWTGVDGIVGYITSLSTDGSFLYASIEITEPDAYDKWARGTYRGRSLEVGAYETNDGAMFWPVVMGCAFVDIPAVEGLYAHQNSPHGGKPVPDQPQPKFLVHGKETTDAAAVQQHITSLEAENGMLSQYRRETEQAARLSFVDGLAKDQKILASQTESLKDFCKDLDDAAFDKFRKTWDAAGAAPLFGRHAEGVTNPEGANGVPDAIETAAAIVVQHKRGGKMTTEQIKATDSFKRVQAAKPDHPAIAGL